MEIPVIAGTIDRRMLVNFRIRPDVAAAHLPAPFEPKVVDGWAMAGICLIRLKHVRPRWMPMRWGISSENAAHRFAVVWHEDGIEREGVYIPRRDTDSRMNAFAGGRLFAGVQHHARFAVEETPERFSLDMRADDGGAQVTVRAQRGAGLGPESVFGSLEQASSFFEAGSLGYSPSSAAGRYDGLELRCPGWDVEALEVEQVRSSFFDDPEAFNPADIAFDCALLMRNMEHEWHSHGQLCHTSAERANCS